MTKLVHFPTTSRPAKFASATARDAMRLLVEHEHATAEHRAATIRLRVAERKLLKFADKVGRPTVAELVRAGRGPMDAYGDALYTLCEGCGGLLTRSIQTTRGENLGVGFATEKCPRYKPASGRK